MNNLDLKNIVESLISTFFEAGKVSREISEAGVNVTIKPDKSPVTNGDIAVDQILKKKIKSLTPNIPIISEESVDFNVKIKHKDFWLIDPIDGTRDYINKKDEYTLNAGLIVDLKPVAGIIYAPKKDRLFFSFGEGKAYEIHNNKTIDLTCKKKNISTIIGLENSGITPSEVLKIYKTHNVSKKIRMSSSLKFCILAAGEADIYAANARAYEWDIAAGHAILIHAGGILTTQEEKEIYYGKINYKNLSLVAKRSTNLKK